MMHNKSNWFENNPKKTFLGLFIVVFFIMLILLEIVISKKMALNLNHGTQRYIRLKEHKPYFTRNIKPSRKDLEQSDNLIITKYILRIDENGFIMPSKIHEIPDASIVFLGGSTTECTFVTESNRFPYLVGRLIEKETGLKINSYNSGVSGNDSLHSIDILLNKVLPLKPHIVVMMHNVNDLSTLALEGSYWNNSPTRSVIMLEEEPFHRSFAKIKNNIFPNTYAILKEILNARKQPNEFSHIKGKRIKLDRDFLVGEFKKNLRTFISINRIRDIIPVLMTQANRLKDQPDILVQKMIGHFEEDYQFTYKEYKGVYDAFNQAIRDVGREDGVLVIDLARKVPQDKKYIYDIAHLNDYGSNYVASIIKEDLISLIKQKKMVNEQSGGRLAHEK